MARFAQQALQQKTASVRFNPNSNMRSTGSLMSLWLRPLSVSAILRPADHHGRSDHRHGSDAWGHSRRLTLAHVDHHRGRRQSRLRRHGDSGRRWRTSEVYHGRTGCAWHRAVCALQKVPEREWKTSLRSFVHKLFWASICFRFFSFGVKLMQLLVFSEVFFFRSTLPFRGLGSVRCSYAHQAWIKIQWNSVIVKYHCNIK